MKRFFTRIFRFFWSWGFLKFVLFALTLIVLLYVEEDWRGARELAAAKARWQAQGYSLNPADCYPPPVPDDQNLAALPVFQMEADPAQADGSTDKRLRDALDESTHGGTIWDHEHKDDFSTLVNMAYAKAFPSKTPPASALAQLEELYPLIVDLRTAAASRPFFRLNQDYGFEPLWNRPLTLLVDQINVAKLLSHDAQLALKENQPQIAADDITCGFKIARGVGMDPSLVGGLVSIGVSAITRSNLDTGLSQHTWNDAQLAQLQDALKKTDCLVMFQSVMRNEVAVFTLPLFERLKDKTSVMMLVLGMVPQGSDSQDGIEASVRQFLWRCCANGWWDMNSAKLIDLQLRDVTSVHPRARTVDAKRNAQLIAEVNKAKELPGVLAPWTTLYAVSAGPMLGALEKFAQGQVQLDEDRIVCGLERYRLSHGAYPPGLDALTPACIDELPHDIMNGEPYHYRLNTDGSFLLYSVGWNQIDDGGKVVYNPHNQPFIDFTQGDWVWPMVKR